MKKIIVLLCLSIISYAQNNNGYVVEYNENISVLYTVYEIPLRINKVESQSQIDYSKISGLLQSYLSADNLNWAKDEYLNKEEVIVRDIEHFNAVKKSTISDYIQLESAYEFQYQNTDYAFVKYSLIFEKLPFPWTSIMILEKSNNRWYISNLLNQNQVLIFLGNLKSEIIIDCLNKETKDIELRKIINRSTFKDKISIGRLSLEIDSLNDDLVNKFYDNRIIDKEAEFRNGSINIQPKTYSFSLYHPFILNSFNLQEYQKGDKNIIINESSLDYYKDKPEKIFLKENIPVDFLSKLTIDFNNKTYYLIKYKINNTVKLGIVKSINNQFLESDFNEIDNLNKIFLKYKTSFFKKMITNPQKIFTGSSGGININEFILYILNNQSSFINNID